jgi:hypothetical protein
MHGYFSDYFNVDPKALKKYGAFNISLLTAMKRRRMRKANVRKEIEMLVNEPRCRVADSCR